MSDVNIGVIKGTVEFDDNSSDVLANVEAQIGKLTEAVSGSSDSFLSMAASVFSGEAALEALKATAELASGALKDLITNGSKSADIEGAFDHMTESANLGYDALQKLRTATHDQIADIDLMKMENKDLGAGMKLTADQMDIMGNAAYALAKVQGIDLSSAMERVNQALLTGRARSLQALTGRIDQTAAEEKFASSLGTTVNQLSAEGKVEGVRLEILNKLAGVTQNVGELHERLADSIQKAAVWWQNLIDKVEVAITTSPVIVQGMLAIQNVLQSTFGGNQQQLIDAIVKKVENLAIGIVGFGQTAISVAKGVISGFMILDDLWNHIIAGWDAVVYAFEAGVQLILKGINLIPGASHVVQGTIDGLEKDMDSLYNSMALREKQVEQNTKTEAAWDASLDSVGKTIGIVQNVMQTAQDQENAITDVHAKNQAAIEKVNKALTDNSQYLKDNSLNIQANKKELDAANAAWNQYYDLLAKKAGNSFDAQKQAIESWRQDQIAKLDLNTTTWSDHWKAINAIADERIAQIGVDSNALYTDSRQKLQDNLEGAQKTFDEMIYNSMNYSQDAIAKQRDAVYAARDALLDYGHTATAATAQVVNGIDQVTAALDAAIAAQQKLDAATSHSVQYDLTTRGGVNFMMQNAGASLNGTTTVDDIVNMAKQGITLQQMIQNGFITMSHMLGQQAFGSETVDQMLGKSPLGAAAVGTTAAGAPPVVNGNSGAAALATNSTATHIGSMNFNIQGPPQETARQVGFVIQKTLGLTRQLPQPAR